MGSAGLGVEADRRDGCFAGVDARFDDRPTGGYESRQNSR